MCILSDFALARDLSAAPWRAAGGSAHSAAPADGLLIEILKHKTSRTCSNYLRNPM